MRHDFGHLKLFVGFSDNGTRYPSGGDTTWQPKPGITDHKYRKYGHDLALGRF